MLRRFCTSLVLATLAGSPLLAAAGCAGILAGDDDDDSDEDDEDDDERNSPDAAARTALATPAVPGPLLKEQLELCVAAVAAATELSGGNAIVVTGTVDARSQTGSYSPTPSDALVLKTPDFDQRFVVEAMQLSAVDTIDDVFFNDHTIACRTSREGAFDLQVRSSLADDTGAKSAEGTVETQGRSLDISFSESSFSFSEVDSSISTLEFEASRTGTAAGDGVDVSWSESERYFLLISQQAFENRTTELALDGDVDGFRFALEDGVIKRSFRAGFPTEPEFWAETAGTLTESGDAFGTLSFEIGDLGEFEIRLTTPDGVEVLETYAPSQG